MPSIGAQGLRTGQIDSKTQRQQPTERFSVPVQTVWAKQRPSAQESKTVWPMPSIGAQGPLLMPGMALRTDGVDLIGVQVSPPSDPRILNWIRPGCCCPIPARSTARAEIPFPS